MDKKEIKERNENERNEETKKGEKKERMNEKRCQFIHVDQSSPPM